MNKCITCQETFESWVEYNEHMALSHWKGAGMSQSPFLEEYESETPTAFATARSSGRTDLGKQAYKGPMDKDVKARIVRQGEIRLGIKHFFGIILLGLLLAGPARADDDGEDGHPGPQGPQGTQGPAGPQGKQGTSGAQGQQGANGQNGSSAHLYGGLDLNLLVYSGKAVDVGLFNSTYLAPSDWANVTGVSLSFGLVDSYEARQRKAQDARIEALERALAAKFMATDR